MNIQGLRRLPEKLPGWLAPVPVVLALLLFGYVALFSLTQISTFDSNNLNGEVVLYAYDSPFGGLLVTGLYGLVAFLLAWLEVPRWPGYERLVTAVVVVITLVGGLWWVFTCQSKPAADSGTVYDTAVRVIAGDYTDFTTSNNDFYNNMSYYKLYPFQLGYVFLSELVYRLCGTETALPMQVVNVLALAAMYAGLLRLARQLFAHRWATTLLAVLLLGCLQPLFFCSFAYGNIPGFAAGVWAACCAVSYMRSTHRRRLWWLAGCAGFLMLAVVAKYNNMIWVIAVVAGLALHLLKTRRYRLLPLLLALLLLPVGAQKLVIVSYEVRSGVSLGSGVSQLMYLRDGLYPSNMAPGWYNDRSKSAFVNAGGDTAVANQQAVRELGERWAEMTKDPEGTRDFFQKKLLSQWNEPSYESLWVSQIKQHYSGTVETGSLLHNIYYGKANDLLTGWFNLHHSAVLLLFCVGMVALLRRRVSPALAMLAAVPLGGGLYHLLCEAKSQYCLTYFIMLVFFAAYGLCAITRRWERKEGVPQ